MATGTKSAASQKSANGSANNSGKNDSDSDSSTSSEFNLLLMYRLNEWGGINQMVVLIVRQSRHRTGRI